MLPVATRALLAVRPTRLFLCVLVVVLWPRLRRVLRAVGIVGGMKCVLFVVVFYVVRVFCLPHCADPDISDTKMEIASKAPYPKPKSRWASHAETPLEQ